MRGVDVSTYQGAPDWRRAAADGVEFAMIKATQGRAENSGAYLFRDSRFLYNITEASDAGIYCGVYHYFTAANTAECEREAEFFLKTIAPYRGRICLWAAVDVESSHLQGIPPAELTRLVLHFCRLIRAAGYEPLVYTNPDWLRNRLAGIGDEKLWLALWRDKNNPPQGYRNLVMWQYGTDTVAGFAAPVDANIGYFTALDDKTPPEYPSSGAESGNGDGGVNGGMDNTPAEWAAEAVQWAQENGILYGDENGNLMLHEPCTREMMLVFLHRAMGGK